MRTQRWWDFESAERGSHFWNSNRGDFDFGDGERNGDEALYRLMDEAIDKVLSEALLYHGIRSFVIRPAFGVRR